MLVLLHADKRRRKTMNLELNAEEILEVACQIERNGSAFYRRAATLVNDEDARRLLNELAELEDEHEIVFENLRGDPMFLSELLGDPEGPACKYLRALANGRIFSGAENPADRLKADVSIDQVIKTAIELEIASIVFYQGIRELITADSTGGKLDAIITEERRHVIILTEALAGLAR
jgi:rubrerythrin